VRKAWGSERPVCLRVCPRITRLIGRKVLPSYTSNTMFHFSLFADSYRDPTLVTQSTSSSALSTPPPFSPLPPVLSAHRQRFSTMETQNGGFLSSLFNSSMFRLVMSRPDAVASLADVTTDSVATAVASNALQLITETPEAVGNVDSVIETATMAASGPGRGVRNVFTYVTSPWAVLCLFMVSVLETPRLLLLFPLAFPQPLFVCFS